jgi:hypothetical protein
MTIDAVSPRPAEIKPKSPETEIKRKEPEAEPAPEQVSAPVVEEEKKELATA